MRPPSASTAKPILTSVLAVVVGCNNAVVSSLPERIDPAPADNPINTNDISVPLIEDGESQVPPNASAFFSDHYTMTKDDQGRFVVEFRGMRFVLTPIDPLYEGYDARYFGNDLSFSTGGHSVQVISQRLTVNGQDFGPISRGDSVTITRDKGGVRVNGRARGASPAKGISPPRSEHFRKQMARPLALPLPFGSSSQPVGLG